MKWCLKAVVTLAPSELQNAYTGVRDVGIIDFYKTKKGKYNE